MTFVLWTVLVVCMAAALGSLIWILWKQLSHLLHVAGRSMDVLGSRLQDAPNSDELLARGVISIPRDVDVTGGPLRVAELRANRAERKNARAERKAANRDEAYARWKQFNK